MLSAWRNRCFPYGGGWGGKLQVLGYKPLHDFDFPEAASLTEAWKQFALSQPNIPLYHLQ